MKAKNMKRAFSLIELSIVILIIGIIIAGVTQSSSLVQKMRLSSARALTKSSPVSGVKDLVFWVESTSEESFSSSIDEGSPISQWNDINPQGTNKNNVVQATSTKQPTYKSIGLNGFPTVSFDGGDVLVGSAILLPAKTFTLFIVYKVSSLDGAWNDMFNNRNGSFQGFGYWKSSNNKRNISFNDAQDYRGNDMVLSPEFVSATYDGNTNINLYTNGSSTDEITTSSVVMTTVTPSASVTIGSKTAALFQSFTGLISEIILFDRVLTYEERHSIEEYLGKKWSIKLNP